MQRKNWPVRILKFILIAAAAVLLTGFVVMSLWNALLPGILHVAPISFGQALGIFILAKILFGGFRGGWGGRGGRRWGYGMQEKWNQMSPEEKEKFRQNWKSRCSQWNRPEEAQ
jgi:hypothetical protein